MNESYYEQYRNERKRRIKKENEKKSIKRRPIRTFNETRGLMPNVFTDGGEDGKGD